VQLQIGRRLAYRLAQEQTAADTLVMAGVNKEQINILRKKSTRQLVALANKTQEFGENVR